MQHLTPGGKFRTPPSLRESVYTHIKDLIINNTLLPGQALYVERLATELGVSRTPVREALLQLQGEDLVVGSPNHGFVVTEISAMDVENVFKVRELLESYAAHEAAPRIPDHQIEHLADLFQRARREIQHGSYDLYLQSDWEMHHVILEHCNNLVLMQMVTSLSERSLRIRYLADTNTEQHVETILAEHEQILAALRRRDAEQARDLMRMHLVNARERTLMQLAQVQQKR